MSLFLQAVYSESLYLLLCVGAFLLAERQRWLSAGIVTGLAMLTRLAGFALLVPILLLAWRSPQRRRALLKLLVAPALACLYPLWLQLQIHAPRSRLHERGRLGTSALTGRSVRRSFARPRQGAVRRRTARDERLGRPPRGGT
jgi:4-amino-4-deoxy-L-arabinose transferase-like glycosyltransferase